MRHYLLLFSVILLSAFAISCSDDDTRAPLEIPDSTPPVTIPSSGFYILNEDWFGHDEGTVNYFKTDGSVVYRAYRKANSGDKLGVTTQFATIYGNYAYFISKQGNRFVVADAKTLKKKFETSDIGNDGRSFIGVTPTKGYISTYKGIKIFDIKNLSVKQSIDGITGEVGNMCVAGNRVFAIEKSVGIHIINAQTDVVENVISGSYAMLTQSKDGNIWIGANNKLIKLNPYTLNTVEFDITTAPINGTWAAWNAGSLCASTQKNVIYWAKGSTIVKFDANTNAITENFFSLPNDENGTQQSFYGASLRVDPISDNIVIISKKPGWGDAGKYNWVHIVNANGNLEKTIAVKGGDGTTGTEDDDYYWFSAMPFFEDANSPVILKNQLILETNKENTFCLSDLVVDADNSSKLIIKTLTAETSDLLEWNVRNDSLFITTGANTGTMHINFHANSNGKATEKKIRVDIL